MKPLGAKFHCVEKFYMDSYCMAIHCRFSSGLDTLVTEVEEHIKEVGQENLQSVLKSENVPTQFVEVMLNVHNKYHEMILTTFQVRYLYYLLTYDLTRRAHR